MRRLKWLLCAVAGFAAGAVAEITAVPSGNYGLDRSHAYLTFSYSHLGFSHPVIAVRRFDVALTLDAAEPEKSVLSVTADASSIESGVAEFDGHLHGTDYFDVTNHPEITFTSSKITMTEGNSATVAGELTIRGVTQPFTLKAILNKAAMHPMQKVPVLGISATGTLKRSAFGLGRYAPAVGDDVTVRVEVELPRKD